MYRSKVQNKLAHFVNWHTQLINISACVRQRMGIPVNWVYCLRKLWLINILSAGPHWLADMTPLCPPYSQGSSKNGDFPLPSSQGLCIGKKPTRILQASWDSKRAAMWHCGGSSIWGVSKPQMRPAASLHAACNPLDVRQDCGDCTHLLFACVLRNWFEDHHLVLGVILT